LGRRASLHTSIRILSACALAAVVEGRSYADEIGLSSSAFIEPTLQLTYRAIYHAYQLRLYSGGNTTIGQDENGHASDVYRNVNPLYQTLDIGGYALASGDVDVVASLRYQTDFGTGFHRDTPQAAGIPAVDGRNVFNILYMYADWRNVIAHRLDLRFGRQLVMDDLAWYRLDGLKATIHVARGATAAVDLETYAGMPVRYDVLFSSPALIPDGYEALDGPGLAFGGAVFARFFGDLSVSAAFRQELTFRGSNIDVFRAAPTDATLAGNNDVRSASAGTYALEQSGIGGSIGYTIRPAHLDLYAHAQWNLIFGQPDILRAGIAYNPARWLHLEVEGYEVRPVFAADSIFNIFNIFPYDRGRAELTVEPIPGLRFEAGYFLLKVRGGAKGPLVPQDQRAGDTSPSGGEGSTFQGSDWAHGPSGGVTFRRRVFAIGAYAEASTNTGGDYAFGGNYRRGEIFGNLSLVEDRVGGVVRGGFTTIQNDWFNNRETGQVQTPATSYYVEIGGRATIVDGIKLNLNVIKNFQSYLEGSYRVLSVLEIRY
jgi:hypothetical protein